MDCKLRFYNVRQAEKHGKPRTMVDSIIMVKSDPLVHVEFEFSIQPSFSATMRDGIDACRFMDIDYTRHSERWTTIILPMSELEEDIAWSRAREINGKPYDLIGLGSFSTRFIKQNPDKYWCSECVAELIKAAYGYGDDFIPHTFTPVGLFFEMYHRIMEE